MPELPEVETVRRGLQPAMEGQVIARARVNRAGAARWAVSRSDGLERRDPGGGCWPLAPAVEIHSGRSGRGPRRCPAPGHVGSHPGVSGDPLGRFLITTPAPKNRPCSFWTFANGARVTFNDCRRFGAMDWWPTDRLDTHPLLVNLVAGNPWATGSTTPPWPRDLTGAARRSRRRCLDQRQCLRGLGKHLLSAKPCTGPGFNPRRLAGSLSRGPHSPGWFR